MSRPRVQLILVCEDAQRAAFVRRFLRADSWDLSPGKFRVAKCPAGSQSAEQWVRENFVAELKAFRSRAPASKIIAVVDADRLSVADRVQQLDQACRDHGVKPREDGEGVAVIVPQRNIETWLAYLDGETVDQTTAYPRLDRESDCDRHVRQLQTLCQDRQLRQPAPPSLEHACQEYRQRLRQ